VDLKRITYSSLKPRQKENFNFQKISAVLADYGFVTLRLSDDWQGADFIAQHIDGAKYRGKDLWVAFSDGNSWYLYPHDELLAQVLDVSDVGSTSSWSNQGEYSFPRLSKQLRGLLEKYRISGDANPVPG
jgi:hypothetical protein